MRKLEFLIVVSVVAVAALVAQRPGSVPKVGPSGPTGTPAAYVPSVATRSGRVRIDPPPFRLAGIAVGDDAARVRAALGTPAEQVQAEWGPDWRYRSDGAELSVKFLEDRVYAIFGQGRWMFDGETGPLPGFMASPEKIAQALGQPGRRDASAWVYPHRPGELTFHFQNGGVSQIILVGQINDLTKP